VKISVTIPTFNRAHLLSHAIDSVLNQTYRNVEILVIDDGSTDGTPDLVARYGDKVRYFRQANSGVSGARNSALDRAAGDCIAFLDSDDYWYPFKLALQVRLLERLTDVGFTFSEFDILKDDGRIVHQGSRTWRPGGTRWDDVYPCRFTSGSLEVNVPGAEAEFDVFTGGLYRRLLDEPLILPTTAVVRRSAMADVRFTPGMPIFEDWEFFAKLARNCTAAFADVATAVNRGHDDPGRITRCSPLTKAESYLEMIGRVWLADPAFCAEYPDVVSRAESAATLAAARTALLARRPDRVRQALDRWRQVRGRVRMPEAFACAVLSRLPGGRHVLRASMVGRSLVRYALSGDARGNTQVNPAA
jgi:glycosyltransferase involved in cell wall biosynthesis